MSAENISYELKRFSGIKRDYTEEEVGKGYMQSLAFSSNIAEKGRIEIYGPIYSTENTNTEPEKNNKKKEIILAEEGQHVTFNKDTICSVKKKKVLTASLIDRNELMQQEKEQNKKSAKENKTIPTLQDKNSSETSNKLENHKEKSSHDNFIKIENRKFSTTYSNSVSPNLS